MAEAKRARSWIGLAVALAMVGQAVAARAEGFDVTVSLTPTAAAKLAAARQRVAVSVSYFGRSTPAFRKKADQMGQIGLGEERVVLPGPGGTAHLTGGSIKRALLSEVEGGQPSVLVNVFSVLPSGPANLLDCGIYEGSVAVAARAPQRIRCKAIGEGGP